MDIKQRTYTRFFAQDNTFAALGSEFELVGKIKDISKKGLALSYLSENINTASDRDLSQVYIFLSNNSFHLPKVPCEIVYDVIDPKSDKNYSIMTRRCGLKFSKLSKSQSKLLELFLENYTSGPDLPKHSKEILISELPEGFLMSKESTYEKLEPRANELSTKTLELNRKDLIRVLWTAVEQSSKGIAIADMQGTLQYLNSAFAKKHGYTPDELIGKNLSFFHTPEQISSVKQANRQLKKTGEFKGELWHLRNDGSVFPGLMHNSLIKDERNNPIGMMGTLSDISYIKQAEEALKKSKNKLELMVKKRTKELATRNKKLEEINTALKVLLTKKDEDKKNMEENILSNVNKMILPYLEKLKERSLDDHQILYLRMLKLNLKEIISPFINKLSYKYANLTPAEIRVADLVRHGYCTKDIAELTCLSVRTIESQRYSIRKKIGIKNKNIHLRSYLLSLH